MVMINYNMKFPIVRQVEAETSVTIIKLIKSVLSEHRNIRELVSDNGLSLKVMNFTNLYRVMVLYTL